MCAAAVVVSRSVRRIQYRVQHAWGPTAAGRLDVTALEQALTTLVARHESLRTHFGVEDGEPFQVIVAELSVALPMTDLRELNTAAQHEAISAALDQEWHQPFDLARGPVLRARLLQLVEDEHVFVFTCHHIVFDGWSVGVFYRELMALYAAFSQHQPDPLPPLSVQYADFTLWQRAWLESGALAEGLNYWHEQLADAPAQLTLPTDRPRPAVQRFAAKKLF
ncbi:hypothetical protein C2W62_07735 [Candidatus Entotheonella serta]|nr:hypothetical protein C2W62_07735 [Candidatus Entotheonella serta]